MDIELLAKQMREAAIRVEREMQHADLAEQHRQQKQLEALKQLYFNAGRWAGGARDKRAREAFQEVSLHG